MVLRAAAVHDLRAPAMTPWDLAAADQAAARQRNWEINVAIAASFFLGIVAGVGLCVLLGFRLGWSPLGQEPPPVPPARPSSGPTAGV